MADITVSNDVDALMRSADNEAIRTSIGVPTPEEIMNPLVEGQGLLNSFVGSAAAYSLRDLNKTNPDVVEVRRGSDETSRIFKANEIGSTLTNWVNAEVALPLDTASGAAAAYSLRDLSVSRADLTSSGDTTSETTGALVAQVRRSSDDEIKSFTAAEVAGSTMVDWVEAAADGTSRLTSDPFGVFNGTGTFGAGTSLGFTATLASGLEAMKKNGSAYTVQFNVPVGETIRFTYTATGLTNGQIWLKSISGTNAGSNASSGQSIYNGVENTISINPIGTARSMAIKVWGSSVSFDIVKVEHLNASGHVTKWYDQSGNDNHAVQATPASQPKVVEGGVLVTDGLKFDGVDDRLDFTAMNASDLSIFTATRFDTVSTQKRIIGSSTSNEEGWGITGEIKAFFRGSGGDPSDVSLNTTLTITEQYIFSSVRSSNALTFFTNGITSEAVTNADLFQGDSIGGSTAPLDGTISEIIIYDSDQTDNRKAIESNMADYHGNIDLPAGFDSGNDEVDGYVATWYDQSGNGNNAVQAVATYQPKIVEGGVLVTDGLKFDGVDDYLRPSNDVITDIKNAAAFVVFNPTTTSGFILSLQYSSRFYVMATGSTTGANNVIKTAPTEAGTTYLRTVTTSGSSATLFSNSEIQGASSNITEGTYGFSPTIGAHQQGSSGKLDGTISEILIYDSDQSLVRKSIEFNINNAYSIY